MTPPLSFPKIMIMIQLNSSHILLKFFTRKFLSTRLEFMKLENTSYCSWVLTQCFMDSKDAVPMC